MGILLSEKIINLLKDPLTVKAVASKDKNGELHLVYKGSVSFALGGNLQIYELNETSQSNKNFTYSLWFKQKISINILGQDRSSFQILGIPVKAIISGREFEEAYVSLQKRFGKETDLSTIWIVEPVEMYEETYSLQRQLNTEKYPLVGHLDRFTEESFP
jgi:hypothetical protein